jgi:formiminoglutamase
MLRLSPPRISLPAARPGDPRLGHLLGTGLKEDEAPEAVILGFPSDEGVRRNGGRVGAAQGPGALREALYRYTSDARLDRHRHVLTRTRDMGDLSVSGDLEADQRLLGETLRPHLDRGSFVIVLGGGHETSYGHFLGYAYAGRSVEILNWDAHTDVRELVDGRAHSGSPFRQAIEDGSGACRRYSVAGLQSHAVAQAHLEYVQRHGRAIWRQEVTAALVEELYRPTGAPLMVSFDLDAVCQAEAPGVSAPNVGGLSGELWLAAAYQAGRCSLVGSADVVELNPRVDSGGQTARLAALTVWWLLRGRAERA